MVPTKRTRRDRIQTEMEIRKEEKVDADRRTDNGAGMEATPDGGDPPPREAPPEARGRPFERGKSGNPNGRPKGHRNKATMAIEELLDGEAERLARKVIDKALEGDASAVAASWNWSLSRALDGAAARNRRIVGAVRDSIPRHNPHSSHPPFPNASTGHEHFPRGRFLPPFSASWYAETREPGTELRASSVSRSLLFAPITQDAIGLERLAAEKRCAFRERAGTTSFHSGF
jgi:Family of unknown function (DUF5681)